MTNYLHDATIDRLFDAGWITPDEVKNVFAYEFQKAETERKQHVPRLDIIFSVFDNIKLALIQRCEVNMKKELERGQLSSSLRKASRQAHNEAEQQRERGEHQLSDTDEKERRGIPGLGTKL